MPMETKKRILALLLASALLAAPLTACDTADDEIDSTEETTEETTTDLDENETIDEYEIPQTSDINISFSDYADILKVCEQLFELKRHVGSNEFSNIYVKNYSTPSNDILGAIFCAIINTREAGYGLKDINNDGKSELFLLDSDYTLRCGFTLENGKPKLLVTFWKDYGAIDNNGIIYKDEYGKGENWSISEARLSENGTLTYFAFGGRDEDIDDSIVEYYKIRNGEYSPVDNSRLSGEYIVIDKAEIDALLEKYNPILSNCSEVTRNSGITFVSFKK